MFRTALISMFLTSTALATTWTVDDDGKADFNNIQAAIDVAVDGDEIVVMPGTYTSTQDGHVVNMLGKAVTLRSSDPSDPDVVATTIIDGESARRGIACFNTKIDETVILGFTIKNGSAIPFDYNQNGSIDSNENDGGGVMCNSSNLVIEYCNFTNNETTTKNGDGGGLYCGFNSVLLISNCVFDNNSVSDDGGGIYLYSDVDAIITDCFFSNNSTNNGYGGAIYCSYDSDPIIINCDFQYNYSSSYGGAMYCYYRSNPNLAGCTFSDNIALESGGGIRAYCSAMPTLTNTVMCNNSPQNITGTNVVNWIDGGGNCVVYFCNDKDEDGWPDACDKDEDGLHMVPDEYSTVQEAIDIAEDGEIILIAPGIYYEHSINPHGKTIQIKGATNADGTPAVTIDAQGKGVVLSCDSGESVSTQFQNLTITGGWNPLSGGGMINVNSSPAISNCVFINNVAVYGGGMLNTGESSPTLHSCVFVDNVVSQNGGGICNIGSSPTLVNCEFRGNDALSSGAIFNNKKSYPTFYDCKFCDNSLPQIQGEYLDAGLNVIEDICSTECFADINDDGQVDVIDLLSIIDAWGDCLELQDRPSPGESILDRQQDTDLRIATWNVWDNFHPADVDDLQLPTYARVIKAIDPDVIVLNEIDRAEDVEKLPEWLSDNVHNGIWQVHVGLETNDRTVICSRYPMTMLAVNTVPGAWVGRGITMALIDCPDEIWSKDFYLMGVHLKAFSGTCEQELRQWSADAIASWLGKIRTNSGQIALPQGTPMVVLGDMNFYPDQDNQPEITILQGDIQHEDTFGLDIRGDWDDSNLTDPVPLDLITGNAWTYWGLQSRLDRFMFTDSVVHVGNSFILNTTTLPEDELLMNGLESLDTTTDPIFGTSDHLPVVVDYQVPDSCEVDLNFDGIVDVTDLLIVIDNWGPCE